MTFSETQTILDGVSAPNVEFDDINSILNLRDAWGEMLSSLNDNLSIDYLCRINYLFLEMNR